MGRLLAVIAAAALLGACGNASTAELAQVSIEPVPGSASPAPQHALVETCRHLYELGDLVREHRNGKITDRQARDGLERLDATIEGMIGPVIESDAAVDPVSVSLLADAAEGAGLAMGVASSRVTLEDAVSDFEACWPGGDVKD